MKQNPVRTSPLIAAIDLGTNSFHAIIASVNTKGILRIHSREKEMVRLGSGAKDMKYLAPDAMERGVQAMRRFGTMAKKAGATVRAIGTSALREAENRDEFVEKVAYATGIHVEVVSGIEEGRLIYVGALHALPILSKRTLIIDIGGGSTETAIGADGDAVFVHSAKLGSIRMTQRFFPDGNSTPEAVQECRQAIKGDLTPTFKSLLEHGFEMVAGTSGTIHTIAQLCLAAKGRRIPETINGITLSREEILQQIDVLAHTRSTAERAAMQALDPRRADIILGGALILEQIILGLNIQKITLSAYALREGIIFDTVQKERDIREFHHLSRLRYETVYHLCELYRVNLLHAEHVKNLALQLFDALLHIHKLGDVERELLEAAALLHDVGYHVSPEQHHKHSYYIISNCVMPGFTNDEAELIAHIARYHRKSHPKKKHTEYMHLPADKQRVVAILAGILRIAEGLDRRQQQYIEQLFVLIQGDTLQISVKPLSGIIPDIEIWGASRRKELLEAYTSRKISFRTV
jgi:exopolyphosphatase/guanosine-5'-triphosphate,3'-diphosphate pyrophosphatase